MPTTMTSITTLSRRLARAGLAALLGVTALATVAEAKDITIQVWSGGTNDVDYYRMDAIDIAADILMRQEKIKGKELNIKVEKKPIQSWGDFKQAVTLAAESGKAPNIVVTGHEDMAPWAQSGLIVPIEKFIDVDSWPVNGIYPNLLAISSYQGQLYGLPQDAESRPFFFWIPHMKAIGYSDADIAALPEKVRTGQYTLYTMLADAKKMQDKGLIQPGYGFYPRTSNGPDYWQFYQSFGGVIEDKSGKLVLDKAAMTKTYKFFADAVAMGVTKKNHIGMSGDQWFTEVATGKSGIWHGGTWHYARLVGKEGLKDFFDKVAFTLTPAGDKDGKANTITHPLVYLVTKQKDEADMAIAAQLIEIASEPRINALHAIKSAHLGISEAESKIDFYSNDRWTREATKRLLPYASAIPNNVGFGQYWDSMWKGLEASWTGQKTPEKAVSDLEAELKAALGANLIVR